MNHIEPMLSNGQLDYLAFQKQFDDAIHAVLKGDQHILGDAVTAFEKEFAAFCEVKHSVAVTSGTSSLIIALLAADIGPGDEVLGVANADLSISLAVLHVGATLKWVDIDENTMNMDPHQLQDLLTPKTRAVIIAHMHGLPADMDALFQVLADHKNVLIIEDASLAVGATYKGKRVGSIGDVGCMSLSSGKILSVFGSGGALTTQNDELYRKIQQVRHYGRWDSPYEDNTFADYFEPSRRMVRRGLNERMDTIQAAIGRIQLQQLDNQLRKRRAVAGLYREILADVPVYPQPIPSDTTHSYRSFVFRVDPKIRDDLVKKLRTKGIRAGGAYILPDHLHPFFDATNISLPGTEAAHHSMIALPCGPHLAPDDVWKTATITRKTIKQFGLRNGMN